MGKPSQERIILKLDLERFLSDTEINPSPKASLEQYTISERVAADMLYLAAYGHGDIVGKTVLDLGCGTGRLALGAAFLGAKMVVGVDLDRGAVTLASETAEKKGLGARTDWIAGDVDAVSGKFDTVLQNPPFGVQKRGADRRFLEKALEVGCSVYSLHNHPKMDRHLIQSLKGAHGDLLRVQPSPFIEKFVEERGGVVSAVFALLMTIPRMFDFHTKLHHDIVVDLYVIRSKGSQSTKI
ncbi:MAG TPA: METTL5 family protein [Candidatus Bathyarchaeia archaeon]|nr:METTL5 family protein [Candidatus Bathyarchaeia archaeon]